MATLPNPLPHLATDPSGRSLGLQLPLGRLIDATTGEVVLWHAEQQAAPGTWKALGRPAGRAGLLPVLVDLGGGQGGPEEWELVPAAMSYPGDHDADEVLAEYWAEVAAEEDGGWPGLAAGLTLTAAPDARATEVADALSEGVPGFKEPHLALVSARRSADLPAAVGWTGPANHEEDVARVCAVLRSWEDRFGIRVVALGFDRLYVSVAAPPADLAQARAITAEHFAFCPSSVLPDTDATLTAYAEDLVGNHTWSFWWD